MSVCFCCSRSIKDGEAIVVFQDVHVSEVRQFSSRGQTIVQLMYPTQKEVKFKPICRVCWNFVYQYL